MNIKIFSTLVALCLPTFFLSAQTAQNPTHACANEQTACATSSCTQSLKCGRVNTNGLWNYELLQMVCSSKPYINAYSVSSSTTGEINVIVDAVGEADAISVELLRARSSFKPTKAPFGIFCKAKASVNLSEANSVTLKVRKPRLYCAQKPWVYGLRVKLIKEGKVVDMVVGYTAICSLPLAKASDFYYKDPSAGVDNYLSLYTLQNGNITMQVTDFGARVISLFAPDRNGNLDDVVVGYGDAERFVHNTGERFLGATVGRVANRIGAGTFTLDGKRYNLPINNNGQTLHGGLLGIDMVVWKVKELSPNSITLTYTAPDGQDGFPGNLNIELTYTLTAQDALDISYKATTDAATPVNLSNHAFYNLRGSKGGPIGEHVLTIAGSGITPIDQVLIPTGKILDVTGTPFDFRAPHAIGERVGENHAQLGFGGGYDHNWVLDAPADGTLHKACELYEPESGRVLEVYTDQPGLQFYGGNFFDGTYAGKNPEVLIGYREALALETQNFPDAINQPTFPNSVLRPGETYTHHSVYSFCAR